MGQERVAQGVGSNDRIKEIRKTRNKDRSREKNEVVSNESESMRDILRNGWHMQPLSPAPVRSHWSDDAGDMRAVSHIIWYTTR